VNKDHSAYAESGLLDALSPPSQELLDHILLLLCLVLMYVQFVKGIHPFYFRYALGVSSPPV